ncbi:MAG: YggS family pyridoxal phosphate-dependent enzyme [Terriglobia bacterium]
MPAHANGDLATSQLSGNIRSIRDRMEAACHRAGRQPQDLRLVAVSKTFPAEAIREAFEAGVRDFGENRVQEAARKKPLLEDLNITWHLIGHLQTNKARTARELFDYVHSIDSFRLASKLDETPRDPGDRLPVLLQVNLGGESAKSGLREEAVEEIAEGVSRLANLTLRGLMLIPPFFEVPEQSRPYFRRLRELAARIEAGRLPNVSMKELSMGMSHDFEVAVEEGATLVRVGTAIFGSR